MIRIAIVVVSALLVSAPVVAQGPTAPGTPLALLSKQPVQKELKLSDEQTTTVKKLHADVKKDPTAAKTAFKALDKTLDAKQYKRLKEISYQVRGGVALGDASVAKALGMTKKQRDEVRSIWLDEEKTLQMLLKVSRFRNAAAQQAYVSNHRKKAGEKMLGTLSPAQQKQFAGMLGEKFDAKGLDIE